MSDSLYDRIGGGYARQRRPDPRIAARIHAALGAARSVLNVGAGTGSYEPDDRAVVAVEPSIRMILQRPPGSAPAVRAVAEALPFPDAAFDAALAVLTVHHWTDWRRGIGELRRVARGPVAILTWDPGSRGFWLVEEYFPEIVVRDRSAFPTLAELAEALGGATAEPVPIPDDCSDGFLGAFWKRPHAYLEPAVRGAISALANVGADDPRLLHLEADLRDGAWERDHRELLTREELDLGYRLVVGR